MAAPHQVMAKGPRFIYWFKWGVWVCASLTVSDYSPYLHTLIHTQPSLQRTQCIFKELPYSVALK